MQAESDAPGAAGHDPDAPRAPASDRLQLEVALLAAETTPQPDEAARAEPGRSPVLVAVADVDIRDYIKQCLRGRPDLSIVEVRCEDGPFDVARRLVAHLVITDQSIVAGDETRLRGTPVLLTGVELPENLPVGDGIRIGFLLQPFNARRLLEAVEHLIRGAELGRYVAER